MRQKIAGFESRRGPLEGLKEIADDPDYLADWHKRADEKTKASAGAPPADGPIFIEAPPAVEVYYPDPEPATPAPELAVDSLPAVPAPERERLQVRVLPQAYIVPPAILTPMVQLMNDRSPSEILCVARGDGRGPVGFSAMLAAWRSGAAGEGRGARSGTRKA